MVVSGGGLRKGWQVLVDGVSLWFRIVASIGELWQVVAIGANSVRLWRVVVSGCE